MYIRSTSMGTDNVILWYRQCTNDWTICAMHCPKYPLELVQSIITVSLEVMKIVRNRRNRQIAKSRVRLFILLEPFMLKMQHPIKNKMFLSNAAYRFYAYLDILGTFLGTFAKI